MKLLGVLALLSITQCFIQINCFMKCFGGGNCPFSRDCICDGTTVICNKCFLFPNFTDNTYEIAELTIRGRYSHIPVDALYPLQGLLPFSRIYLEGSLSVFEAGLSRTLVMDNTALHTYNNVGFSSLYFSYFNMSQGWSNVAFANISIPNLFFTNNAMPVLDDYAFNLLQTNSISIENCNISWVNPAAFSGLIFGSSSSVVMANNKLTNLYTAFKILNAVNVNLQNNSISAIDDFTFCKCNIVGRCSNDDLQSLQLGYNPIVNISNYAFANLHKISNISLKYASLNAIPVAALTQVATTLVNIDLSINNIAIIDVNSFLNFDSLKIISFDYNPILDIAPGAFNGVSAMTALVLSNLHTLENVDALVTYGMKSVATLSFENCSMLQYAMLNDFTKLPPRLTQIDLSVGNDIRQIDLGYQYWLTSTTSASIDISNNKNFNCQPNIQWMAPFALCRPAQILIRKTFCNGSTTSLGDYLATFNPKCN